MPRRPEWTLVILCLLAAAASAGATDPPGAGLAMKYPGDRGLGSDPAILVFEDFDEETISPIIERWEAVSNENQSVLALADNVPAGAGGAGRRSLQLTARPGVDTGGHLYRRLPREVDELYLRFYVQFPEPANYVHHFVHVGGYRPSTPYPQGGAGERPRGDERVTVGIEPFGRSGAVPPPGQWNLYAYWHEMKRSADNRYWGNSLTAERPSTVPAGRWQCVELRFKLSTPGKRDGRLTLWLDGREELDLEQGTPRGPWSGLGFQQREDGEPFEGFDFRTTDELKLNFVWLLHYVTETNQARNKAEDPGRPCVVRFDQVVAATQYIGPIAGP